MNKVFFTLLVPAALILVGCENRNKEMKTPRTIQQIQEKAGIPVTAGRIGKGVIRRIERSRGTLLGAVEATLANGMGGTVSSIKVTVGDAVKKDEIVAVMDIDGGSPVDVAQSAFEYAEKAYERAQKLQVQGAISKEQVDGARVQYENAKRSLGQATVGVNVTAPFSGTVVEVYETEGSKIGAKTRLVKIADLSKMEIQMQVNEEAIRCYKKGQKAFLLMDNDTIWGSIERIALGANDMSHSFKVTASFRNRDRRLKPGVFKQVYTIVEEKDNALYVPIEVVNFSQDNEPYLYTVDNGRAIRTNVILGITTEHAYEITQGCTSDDLIILSGLTTLRDSVKVNVVNK
jgi:membrane fusion protein, multidrug efflux system